MNQLSLFAAFACRFSPSDSDIQSRGNSSRPLALRGKRGASAAPTPSNGQPGLR